MLNESAESVSLRLIDRGELVAQCNISALPTVEPGMRMTMIKFQEDVELALGKNFGRWISAGEATTSSGHDICRVLATGDVEQLAIQWNYFLVADAKGHQAVLAFTMESDLVGRFDKSDDRFVTSLEFLEPRPEDRRPANCRRRAEINRPPLGAGRGSANRLHTPRFDGRARRFGRLRRATRQPWRRPLPSAPPLASRYNLAGDFRRCSSESTIRIWRRLAACAADRACAALGTVGRPIGAKPRFAGHRAPRRTAGGHLAP